MSESKDTALDQAHAQMASVRALVAALEVDYDELGDLREARQDLLDNVEECEAHEPEGVAASAREELTAWDAENGQALADLEEQAGDVADRDEAQQRIQEDALSCEVRSGWTTPGNDFAPEEFRIVLCTGGPHVEIRGELDEHMQPSRAWLEYAGWGERGERTNEPEDQEALLVYAACFYFGE